MAATTPKAIDDCHELLLWIIPQLDKFPRDRRFTLGERIETGVLDVLARLSHKKTDKKCSIIRAPKILA